MASADPVDLFPPAPRNLWRRPRLAGAALMAILVAVVVIALPGGAIHEATSWTVRDADWVPGVVDGSPHRPVASVQARRVGEWRPIAPERVQIQHDFEQTRGETEDLTLVLPAVNGSVVVFINGVQTEPEVRAPASYLALRGARASSWTIPAHFLRPGLNRLDLLINGSRHRPLEAPPVLGPRRSVDGLQATLGRTTNVLRGALPILALITTALGLGAAVLDRGLTPWLALSAAAAAFGARILATDPVLDHTLAPFGPVLDQAGLAAGLVCLALAMPPWQPERSLTGRTWLPWAAMALFVLLLALALTGAYRQTRALEPVGLALPLLGLICLTGAGWRALRAPAATRSLRERFIEGAGLGLALLTTGAALVGASGLLWGPWVPLLDTIYGAGVLSLLVGMAGLAGLRTGQGAWRWVRDRPRLSRIIQSQKQEIEAAAIALREQERRSAVLEERQRLSRDMHDGIGGQLTSLLARVRSRGISADQLEGELTSGLAELRLMVDSLDASDGPVADALAVLRSRVRTQSEAAGMTLEWSQSEDLNGVVADPRWILNLNRMIQEAVTNALRHSGGASLGVDVRLKDDHRLAVTVHDDGIGFDRDQVRPGRGLSNLTFRAAQLSGSIHFSRGEAGRGAIVEAVIAAPQPSEPGEGHSTAEMMPS